MNVKKLGWGSLSLLLVVIAFLWAFTIKDVCIGDRILSAVNLPAWSDSANASGTHYTVFYAWICLVPALFLGLKFKSDRFAIVGKRCTVVFLALYVVFIPFMAI